MRCSYFAIASLLCCAVVITQSQTHRPDETISPQVLFKRLAPSVFVVEALDESGTPAKAGSGVALTTNEIVTNCHVTNGSGTVRVRQSTRTWPAELMRADEDHDICRLKVTNLKAVPVALRGSADVAVGERVFALGAPQGLELSFSEGIISGVRSLGGGERLLQTTAAISPGSSGGGLFDVQGRLVGITSLYLAESQNLNFAIPAEVAGDISSTPELERQLAEVRAAEKSGSNNTQDNQSAGVVVGDTAANFFEEREKQQVAKAKAGDPVAQYQLAIDFEEGLGGLSLDYVRAEMWFRRSATQGYAPAQTSLARMLQLGYEGVPQDLKEAVIWDRKAAEQGYDVGEYRLGCALERGEGVPQDFAQAAIWYRKSADQGERYSQSSLGQMYLAGRGVPRSYTEAYYWLNLAFSGFEQRDDWGKELRDDIQNSRDEAGSHLSPAELRRVQERCRRWAVQHPRK